MKNLSRKLCMYLFLISAIILTGFGCIDIYRGEADVKDVSNKEPYSQFIGKKYRLEKDCYITQATSGYYIYICGENDIPAELNEKYIGTKVCGRLVAGVLPKGTEFTIKKITLMYSDGHVIFIGLYVEIISNKIIADAYLLLKDNISTITFEEGYVEMVDPEPEKK